jgi:hypothetical protein
LDVSSIINKYILIGSRFRDAEIILKAAGVDLAPSPPRPADPADNAYDRFNIRGAFWVYGFFFGDDRCQIVIQPENTTALDNTKVKEASGVVYVDGL